MITPTSRGLTWRFPLLLALILPPIHYLLTNEWMGVLHGTLVVGFSTVMAALLARRR